MESEETNGSLSRDPDGEPEVDNSNQDFVGAETTLVGALGGGDPEPANQASVKDASRQSLEDPEAEQSRQSTSSCCSSPPGTLFATGSPNRPQEMQPRNIVPPLSPNPSDELGSPGPQTGSTGNNSFMLTQSHSMPQQSQFQPYGMPGQMQPQMLQMLQIQQSSGGMLMPPQLTPNGTPVDAYSDDRFLKRRKRCGECGPCKVNKNCDQCKNCLNRKVLKQTCIYRKCIYLRKKEQGGDGDILDYPSPVPPPTSVDSGGFLPRPSGGQISPSNGSSNTPQQQPSSSSSSQSQQSQQQQQQTQSQQQQQPQSSQQPVIQMQPPQQVNVTNGGSLPPGQQPQPPAFLAHGQGFPMQYGGMMNNGGYVPGGPMMPNANIVNSALNQQQAQQQQTQAPLSQPPPGSSYMQQPLTNSTSLPQQRQFNVQMPMSQQQAQMAQQQMQQPPPPSSSSSSSSTVVNNPLQQQPSQQSAVPPTSNQFKNTRQALQTSLPDAGDLGKTMPPGKPFGNGPSANSAVSGGDSLSAILQQQQSRLGNVPTNSSTNNGYGGPQGPAPSSSTSSTVQQQQQLNRIGGGGMIFTSTAPPPPSITNGGDPSLMNGGGGGGLFSHHHQPPHQNQQGLHQQQQLHAHHHYPGSGLSSYSSNGSNNNNNNSMDPSNILQQQHQIQQQQMSSTDYQPPYPGGVGGSDNPFCHLKMCGGTGHDQKFLSLISYNDCYLDPQQAYSHYYHQIPQNSNYSSTNSSTNNNNNNININSSLSSNSNSFQMQAPMLMQQQHHHLHHLGPPQGPGQEINFYANTPSSSTYHQIPGGSANNGMILTGAPGHSNLLHQNVGTAPNQAPTPQNYHHTANSVA